MRSAQEQALIDARDVDRCWEEAARWPAKYPRFRAAVDAARQRYWAELEAAKDLFTEEAQAVQLFCVCPEPMIYTRPSGKRVCQACGAPVKEQDAPKVEEP